MSLGKLPGFKGLVAGSQGKRRFKSDLSVDMIGPPMGDFRHTMHVGRGGDVFGDTSFLSNHGGGGGGGAEPGSPDSAGSGKTAGFFQRTFRHVRRIPEPPRSRGGSRELSSPPPPPVSPIIKNAVSLPQLNVDPSNGCLQRVPFPSSTNSSDPFYCYGLQSGFITLPRLSRMDKQFTDGSVRLGSSPNSGGLTSTCSDSFNDFTDFTFDLGPSLMSEVLSLIDGPGDPWASSHGGGEAEGREEADEEDVALGSPAGFPNNRGRSRSSDWTERGEDDGSVATPPDASSRSPQGAEPVIEAERFRRAADVLSRHYGVGGSTPGRSLSEDAAASPRPCLKTTASFSGGHKAPSAFSEEEEEIKV